MAGENGQLVAPVNRLGEVAEKVVLQGDLRSLTPEDRCEYYAQVCQSIGVNPLTRPFEYIVLSGKLTLYARRDCTDQLRTIHGISITDLHREQVGDQYVVTAKARDRHGREDTDMGCVTIGHLKGDQLSNAMLKAITKAKRRVTLSICGLGFLDETEIETIPDAKPVPPPEKPAAKAPPDNQPTPTALANGRKNTSTWGDATPTAAPQPTTAVTGNQADVERAKAIRDNIQAKLRPGVAPAAEVTDSFDVHERAILSAASGLPSAWVDRLIAIGREAWQACRTEIAKARTDTQERLAKLKEDIDGVLDPQNCDPGRLGSDFAYWRGQVENLAATMPEADRKAAVAYALHRWLACRTVFCDSSDKFDALSREINATAMTADRRQELLALLTKQRDLAFSTVPV